MYCAICGDENKLGAPRRYWSPDDGWRYGRFCPACRSLARRRRPKEGDFAYTEANAEMGTDGEMDSYIDAVEG